ncbi:thiamine phosphate synthase [Nostoc punctiforme]|uniref:Thiamine monophosphate synthase n=1 Tax=Nostoc punctiforme (strain ATCC 29133 / PCC 73102) TaxID=63737 RepID=B2JAU6_NOSP7|nr:thiamine phosphate synthase [Nostoc punctiforme]ACC85050.1 thiamine monophosphate synthase [Nostoc punctiforme PCC 73102]
MADQKETIKPFKKIAIFDIFSGENSEIICSDKSKIAAQVNKWVNRAISNGADSCYVRLYEANKENIDTIIENLSYKILQIILPFSLNYKSSLVSAFHFREKDQIKMPEAKSNNVLFGKSCHSLKSIEEAEYEGLDYVFFSPIFATPTHPEAKGIGLDMLTQACKSTQMKVFALGGINENNYQKCLDAGASGIAAISMFKK